MPLRIIFMCLQVVWGFHDGRTWCKLMAVEKERQHAIKILITGPTIGGNLEVHNE